MPLLDARSEAVPELNRPWLDAELKPLKREAPKGAGLDRGFEKRLGEKRLGP